MQTTGKAPLGFRVEGRRRILGITRAELARRIKGKINTVDSWASRGTAPRDMERVAEALECTVGDIYATPAPADLIRRRRRRV